MEHAKLLSGYRMPMLGLGTWMLSGKRCTEAVKRALSLGYTHIDTADYYRNHADIAAGIAGHDRSELFITSKVWMTDISADGIDKACRRFLSELSTDYLDLLLIHWPNDDIPIAESMGAMERLEREGLVRSIGVSNFDEGRLSEAISACGLPVCVDQVEFHPRLYQKDLLGFCSERHVQVTAYSPLGRGEAASEPLVKDIARSLGKTPGQVALRWLVQHGVCAIPKATGEEHLRENIDVFSWKISDEDMKRIDALGAGRRIIDPAFGGKPFFDD